MSLCESYLYPVVLLLLIMVSLKFIAVSTLGIAKSNTCLIGKTVLITGGNSGIGFQTALALAGRSARIIIADKNDATESISKIIKSTGNINVVYKYLDLSSLASVRHFATKIKEEENRLDILINNAGASGLGDKFTEDGLQLDMQVNYFGSFLLTHLLIDLLKKSAPSRILSVSSLLAFINNVTPENLNEMPKIKMELYSGLYLYGNSKVMNVIAANIFAEKLRGSGVTSNSLHPGLVTTPIYSNFRGPDSYPALKFFVYKILLRMYGKTAWEGAQTQIECSLSKDLENVTGKYFMDCKTFRQPSKAMNKNLCMELWKKSEDLVKLTEEEKLK